jgi:oligopeptidase B
LFPLFFYYVRLTHIDPYGWLRDDKREKKEIIDHLEAENEYTKAVTKHLEPLQEELYKEFLGSIQETDYTTPRPRGNYWYYTRTFEGKSYTQYCRARKTSDAFKVEWDGSKDASILPGEEVYLDVNELGKGKSYCSLGAASISPSQRYLAYSVDYKGDETYEAHVKDLETGKEYPLKLSGEDKLLETSGTVFWGSDESTLFYMTMDENHRPYRLYRRDNWQEDAATDQLLKEELDDVYWADASKSLDGNYVFFETASSETSEVWFLKLKEESNAEMQCIAKRRNKVLYEIEHGHDQWWIWTNVDGSPNMKLMKSPAKAHCTSEWELVLDSDQTPVFDGSYSKALDSVTVFENHVVVEGRQGGIPRVWVYYPGKMSLEMLTFDEPAHDVGLSTHYEFDTKSIAVSYDSLTTPLQTIEISLDSPSESRTVLKAKDVPGYEKETYGCDRLHVLSRDGETQIPISVVYRRDVMEKVKNGEKVPVHLYGYGSYGSCCEADFDSTRLPLLNRGMIYVIAHIRGGGEMGRQWYEEPMGAKYLCKKNTFNDFVDIAKYLVKEWTTPDMLSCEGRSAGGLLIGASINQAPELFRTAILGVPFVDVACTMVDASIPLVSYCILRRATVACTLFLTL